MLLVLRILLAILVIGVVLIAVGIAGNRVPLTSPPGVLARLKIYLTTHQAEIRIDSPFPELRPRDYPLPPQQLYALALTALADLHWRIVAEDSSGYRVQAVVVTRLWRFKDDVRVMVEPTATGSRLRLLSSSRVGRGDLGANTRHILDFSAALEARVAALNPRR